MNTNFSQFLQRLRVWAGKFSREQYLYVFFGFFLLYTISTLFDFTVLNHAYYQELADKQQISTTKMPVSRGNILSHNGKVLAASIDLKDLAIDPSLDGDKARLALFLRDTLYTELCHEKAFIDCRRALNRFLGVSETPDFRLEETYIKDKILTRLNARIYRTKVTSVLVSETLSSQQIFDIEQANLLGAYINGTYLYVNPEEIVDDTFFARTLGNILSMDTEILKQRIQKKPLKYLLIQSRLSLDTTDFIRGEIQKEKQLIDRGVIPKEEGFLHLIILESNHQRYYPENTLASIILGFVDRSGTGRYGVEGYFDSILRGQAVERYAKKDIQGRLIETIGDHDLSVRSGANITLTIDRNIQKLVEEIIDIDIFDYQANNISAIVMDPKTGRVLAMASHPRYNPNSPGEVFELVKVTPEKYPDLMLNLIGARVLAVDNVNGSEYIYDGKKIFLREIAREEYEDPTLEKYVFANRQGGGAYKNDIIQDLYEVGSIFKPIIFSAGIDSGEITRSMRYNDTGSVKIDNFTIKNVSSRCLGNNTFQNAMNYSCNVGMIRITQAVGASIFHKYLEDYGLGKKTGIELEGEVTGRLDPYEKWSKAQMFTTSFGQGITATMIQMAAAYSVLANGGVYYKPQIVDSIAYPDGRVVTNQPEITHRVLQESTSRIMTEVLVDGVNNGVAKQGAVPGYSIAGKTGTAQIAYKGEYETGPASTLGFFAGYGPAEDPKFVIIVKIERPRSSIFGGETVARTFSRIASELLNYYAIPPKEN